MKWFFGGSLVKHETLPNLAANPGACNYVNRCLCCTHWSTRRWRRITEATESSVLSWEQVAPTEPSRDPESSEAAVARTSGSKHTNTLTHIQYPFILIRRSSFSPQVWAYFRSILAGLHRFSLYQWENLLNHAIVSFLIASQHHESAGNWEALSPWCLAIDTKRNIAVAHCPRDVENIKAQKCVWLFTPQHLQVQCELTNVKPAETREKKKWSCSPRSYVSISSNRSWCRLKPVSSAECYEWKPIASIPIANKSQMLVGFWREEKALYFLFSFESICSDCIVHVQ